MPLALSVVQSLCTFNINILTQAISLIDQLERVASPNFEYRRAVGPHIRHVIDHYTALFLALETFSPVEYDKREREELLQANPILARRKLESLILLLKDLSKGIPIVVPAEKPLKTLFKSGEIGQYEVEMDSTLGRELIFVAHHAIHHYAILSQVCLETGIKLDPDFGKAPATIHQNHI